MTEEEKQAGGGIGYPRGSTPVPDPTELTTRQMTREIALAREVIETRLTGMDKAIQILQTITDRVPEHIAVAVARVQELHEEKFRSIQTQFEERDVRTKQTTDDSKVAIGAALQAAKEAVGAQNESNSLAISKSEAAFTKQMDQMAALVSTMGKNIDEKINDTKDRIGAIENRVGAVESRREGGHDVWGMVTSAISIVISIAAIVVVILIKHSP